MTRRTIVQLESFYPQFLQETYNAFPGLAGLPFTTQIANLLGTGFSGGHNVVPYLDPSRWESHYIVVNCPWSQQRWAAEQRAPAGLSMRDVLAAQLRAIKPDVLYLSDIPGFDFSILDELSPRPAVVGWHATSVSDRTPWRAFDLVLSGIQAIRDAVTAQGTRAAATYMPAAPAYLHVGPQAATGQGVVFSGSFYGGIHDQRAQQFRRLSAAIGGMDIHTPQPFATEPGDFIRFHPAVYGHAVIGLYARHAMVLDSRGDFSLGDGEQARETSNMRVFEATRAGSLLLTEHSPNLSEYFEPGHEIETYRSFDELVDKIGFYADPANEAARRRVAEAGLARVRRSHLIEHRAAWLDSILTAHLGGAKAAPSSVVSTGALGLAAISASSAHTAFLLTATRSSVVFAMAQAEQVRQHHPDADCIVACLDQASHALLKESGAPIGLIAPDELAQAGLSPEPLSALGDDLAPVLAIGRSLFDAQPALRRVTWLGSDLAVVGPVDTRGARDELLLADCDFGTHLDHAREQLGHRLPLLLSLPRPAADSAIASMLGSAGPAAIVATAVAEAAAQSGLTVRSIAVQTPWQDEGAAAQACLAYLGPLSFVELARWQFMPFESAPQWSAFLQRVYVPQLQRLQSLYSRVPALALQGDQYLRPSSAVLADYLARHEFRVKGGYRILSEAEYRAFANETSGWDTPSVAAIQHESFRQLLDAFRAGRQRGDMKALTRIFSRIARPDSTVLEEGCGSGYNSELIRMAAGESVRYTGIDIAHSMVNLARQTYPGDQFAVMPSEHLEFPDQSFDIVLNGASLMHTIDYDRALAEARRVARRHVVLHTVTVADTERNVHFEKNAYGSRVPEVCFSAKELDRLLTLHDLLPVQVEDSIAYDLLPSVGVSTKSVSVACFCLPPAPPKPNHYCTYFDANYLPRGVLMMRSLLRHDPTAIIHVLCLDEPCAKALGAIESLAANVRLVRLPELLEADPEFAASRSNRSQIEWYFTATSCLVNYLLQRQPDVERLSYLDGDLYFYASPAVLLDEARGSSVHIIEHRFSPQWAQLVAFGRFNVGWIGFSNSEEGRRVVADYRAKCLEWCYDRLEGDRFGDQKYLDKWPQDFAGCCVSQLQGANVAWWNLANAQPRTFANRVFVGADLLLFFHFQEIKRLDDGLYVTKKDPAEYGAYHDMVYAPYMAELSLVDAELRPLIDNFKIKDIRYQSW